jgi:class 3 adenylate cyclase
MPPLPQITSDPSSVLLIQNAGLIILVILIPLATLQLKRAKADAKYWRKKAENLLTTMLPAHIIKDMMRGKLPAREIYGTVMYTDLVGFTAYSKDLPPQEVEAALTNYFTAMSKIVERHGGWVNKFLGDGILAIFGLDTRTRTSAEDAARAAIEMREVMNEFPWQIRIGIATGPFIVGEFGSSHLRRFDCVGHTVNFGSRLQSLAESGSALVCEKTFLSLYDKGFSFLPRRIANVKGIGDAPMYPLAGYLDDLKMKDIEPSVPSNRALTDRLLRWWS